MFIQILKHLLRTDLIHLLLVIRKDGRTIWTRFCQIRPCPVEHRHEIITDQMNVFFSQMSQRFNILLDILLSVLTADLDSIVDIHTFYPGKPQAGCLHFLLQHVDLLPAPDLSRLFSVESRDHACHPGDLTDLF